jgi:ribonuclease-3
MLNINKIEKDLKIKFINKQLIISALTHKSANENLNNEKLEFLGDRVLGLVISKKLFDLYPDVSEGALDKRFALLVNRKTCCEIAWSIGVQNYLVTGNKKKKIVKNDIKILSDCCEAVIGAIYVDRGFDVVEKFIQKNWKKKINKSNVTILDPKTKLQEHSLKKFKKLPIYNIVSSSGPKHKPTYKIAVSIEGSKKVIGDGSSKQAAELDCAYKLLKDLNIK